MINSNLNVYLIIILAALTSVLKGSEVISFPEPIFTLNSLGGETDKSGANGTKVITYSTENGNFKSNVNVIVQDYTQSIQDYADLTNQQIKDAGLKLILQKEVSPNDVAIEYSGNMNGQNLHFYARFIKKGNLMYIVTGTSSDGEQWKRIQNDIVNCVNSFHIN